jgi:hypothetical protein
MRLWCDRMSSPIGTMLLVSDRDGRLGLNSVSVPIDGFLTDPFHRLPLRGVA